MAVLKASKQINDLLWADFPGYEIR
jgi:hypothetical protein